MKYIALIILTSIALCLNARAAALAELVAADTSYAGDAFPSNSTFAAGGGFGNWITGGDSFFPGGNKNNGFGTYSNNIGVNNGVRLDFAGTPTTLSSGQSFIVDFRHESIASGGAAAVELWSGGTSVFSFYFNGGDANYGYFVNGSGDTATDLDFTFSVQEVRVSIGAANAFNLYVNNNPIGSGTLSSTVDNFRVVNRGANTVVVDNISIIPEPSIALLSLLGLGVMAARRRRS